MDPPSTPAPVALRGRKLDRALCEAEPQRRAWSGHEPPPSYRAAREADQRMAFAESFVIAERRAPRSNGPLTMRGSDLAAALEALRSRP